MRTPSNWHSFSTIPVKDLILTTTSTTTLRASCLALALCALQGACQHSDDEAAKPGAQAQGGASSKQEHALAHFTGLALDIPGDAQLRFGETESITIEGPDSVLAQIETPVEKGTLQIRTKSKGAVLPAHAVTIIVQAKKGLEHLSLGGTGSITAIALPGETLDINVGGSGSISAKGIEAQSVSINIGGTGSVSTAGNTRGLSVAIGGAGNVDAANLKSSKASVNIGGAGKASMWANDDLDVTIAGLGDVSYYGNPTLSKTVVGAGTIKRLGDQPH
jgi:hypothetical protein